MTREIVCKMEEEKWEAFSHHFSLSGGPYKLECHSKVLANEEYVLG